MTSNASKHALPGSRSRLVRYMASAAIAVGVMAIAFAASYTYWKLQSGSDADRFNVTITTDAFDELAGVANPSQADSSGSSLVSSFASIYPGGSINPRYWNNPEWAGTIPFGAPGIPAGFTPVSSRDPVAATAAGASPIRIRIPAIKLDSDVAALALLDVGDQSSYQTPDNTVGHIPETVNPGQLNNGWYFGHLESFGTGEGSVFSKLPQISELLRHDPVDIFIETDDSEYMYRVTSTRQVPQDQLQLSASAYAEVTLVTCWPPKVYDKRVLVKAELIAVRRA
ncbi:MAG: sortase [Chloroflexi bacterium]|nr:sortase [Chloroflexota bacterium]